MAQFDFGDGVQRKLRFTLASVRTFKDLYGKPLWRVRVVGEGEILPEIVDSVCLTHAIHAALLPDDPASTLAKTEALFQKYIDGGGRLEKVVEAFRDACRKSGLFGNFDEAEAEAEEKNAPGAG